MTLQTKQESKNGGPYTKAEQEERRRKVYELYFENRLPAIKIADELGVSRNTINSDIKLLLAQVSSRLGDSKITGAILTQIQRLEIQRKRLLDILDQKDFQKTIAVERVLLEVEGRICSILSKVGNTTKLDSFGAIEGITEEEISEFVRDTVFSTELGYTMSKSSIHERIVSFQKCDVKHAGNVFGKMLSLGLREEDGEVYAVYNLHKFALLRQYISPEENSKLQKAKA